MKMIFAALFLSISGVGAMASSTHLDNFKIQQCRESTCVKANGLKGFVSGDGNILAADNVTVEFTGRKNSKIVCDSFRYELRNQYLVCDNRDGQGRTFIVDADLMQKNY